MSDQPVQNIIVVGASLAGHNLVNLIYPGLPSTHRILLVDALEYTYWPIAAFRAATVSGWENKITVPLTNDRIFPKGSHHQVLAPNKLLECRENSVVLEHPFEGSTEVPFWRCVIATGAAQRPPMVPDSSWSEQEYIASLRKSQVELREARKVVIIGGGAVGLEFAGDIREVNSQAEITIVHPRSTLLNPTSDNPVPASTSTTPTYSQPAVDPRLSQALVDLCHKQKVDMIFSDRVVIPAEGSVLGDQGVWDGTYGKQEGIKELTLKSGKKVEADYVILGAGMTPNSWMVENADKNALDGKLIRVNDHLKVCSTDENSLFKGQYYAIGDVSSAPGFKVAKAAINAATYAATNIKAELKGKGLAKYNPGLQGIGLPVGHTEGAGMVCVPWVGNWVFGRWVVQSMRGKTLGVPRFFAGRFQGSEKVEFSFNDV